MKYIVQFSNNLSICRYTIAQ